MKHALQLLNELEEITQANLNQAKSFEKLPLEQLNAQQNPKSWSILECLQHLLYYGDFYHQEIDKTLAKNDFPANDSFSPGYLGDKFAQLLRPKPGAIKMPAPPGYRPNGSKLNVEVVERFIGQQEHLLLLLEKARHTDLTRTKVGISLAPWLKLRLGDIFKIVVYHNQRHVQQAQRALKAAQAQTTEHV